MIDPAERSRLARAKIQDSETEEEYESKHSRRKKKKENVRDFFLDEAEVDDDVEDDEEAWNDGYENDILGADREEAEAGISAREIEAKMRKDKGDNSRMGFPDDKLPDEEEINAYYRNKYNEGDSARQRFGQSGEAMSDEITQQQLLPGVKDPNLWMVKCLPGTEKDI
jgi:transcription elongation factor SPT5